VIGKKGDPGREAWISAAFCILADDGVEGLRIERIAKKLNVSKGPFYWRFADRAELLRAILQHWKSERTGRLIEAIAGIHTPRGRLEELMKLALEGTYQSIDIARLEGAFRAWAAHDREAAELVSEVDAERLRYLETELSIMGASTAEAKALGHGIYLALIGLYTARSYTPELANDDAYRRVVMLALDAADGGRGS
jgi:AcrR family transcriptional regulator